MGLAFSLCISSAWQNAHHLLRNIWFMNENKPSNAREEEDRCDQHIPLLGAGRVSKVPISTPKGEAVLNSKDFVRRRCKAGESVE